MKDRYIKHGQVILLALLLLSIGACKKDDFLQVDAKDALNEAIVFSSEANADLFVNDIYNQLPDINNEYQISDQYTDNSFCGASWETGQSTVRSGSITPSNDPGGPANMWDYTSNFNKIRKCNVLLANLNKYKANFSADFIKHRSAEARYLRAFFYTLMYENYGGVPIITTPLDNTSGTPLFFPRASNDAMLAFIETECDAAAADLPVITAKNAKGRATQGAAITLKGAAELFAASPLFNTSNDLSKWAKAAATNNQIIQSGNYSLFPDYAGLFLSGNNDNQEIIFNKEYQAVTKGTQRDGMLGPVYVKGVQQAWGNLEPTQSLVDDYLMDNGLPIADPASGYDPQNPYTHREPRFYQSIIYDGSMWQGGIITTRIGGNNEIDLGSTSDITNTAYYGRKTLDESITGQASLSALRPGGSNYIFFRYAEVLLNYAEAQNEAVGADNSVYNALNLLRTGRPTSGVVPALVPGSMTQSQMRDYIRRERRIELAFEDKRWFDIRRWKITTGPNGVLTTPDYGMKITTDPVSGKLIYTKVNVFNNKFFDYQNILPIPQGVIDRNPKLVQNPGY